MLIRACYLGQNPLEDSSLIPENTIPGSPNHPLIYTDLAPRQTHTQQQLTHTVCESTNIFEQQKLGETSSNLHGTPEVPETGRNGKCSKITLPQGVVVTPSHPSTSDKNPSKENVSSKGNCDKDRPVENNISQLKVSEFEVNENRDIIPSQLPLIVDPDEGEIITEEDLSNLVAFFKNTLKYVRMPNLNFVIEITLLFFFNQRLEQYLKSSAEGCAILVALEAFNENKEEYKDTVRHRLTRLIIQRELNIAIKNVGPDLTMSDFEYELIKLITNITGIS